MVITGDNSQLGFRGMGFPLFTSIPPKSDFRPIIRNWEAAGFHPISINNRPEAQELLGSGIEIIPVEDANPKLSLRDILNVIPRRAQTRAGLINADCRFIDRFSATTLPEISAKSLILAERIDIDQHGRPVPYLPSGFDAMFFDVEIIGSLEPHRDYRLGMPWWDYWLPIAVSKAHHKVHRLECPILLHTAHDSQWDEAAWRRNAELFIADFKTSDLDPVKVSADTFHELLAMETVPVSGLPRDIRLYLAYLHDCIRENDRLGRQLDLVTSSRAYRATEPIRRLSRWLR